MMAVLIINPASQEPPGRGGGEWPVDFRRCMTESFAG
jgi:hypothetical protein